MLPCQRSRQSLRDRGDSTVQTQPKRIGKVSDAGKGREGMRRNERGLRVEGRGDGSTYEHKPESPEICPRPHDPIFDFTQARKDHLESQATAAAFSAGVAEGDIAKAGRSDRAQRDCSDSGRMIMTYSNPSASFARESRNLLDNLEWIDNERREVAAADDDLLLPMAAESTEPAGRSIGRTGRAGRAGERAEKR